MRRMLTAVLLLGVTACGAAGTIGLTDVVDVRAELGSSCGLRYEVIEYGGERWEFDLSGNELGDTPRGWLPDPVHLRIGRDGSGDVWAVGPDGSRLRLVRVEEALLLCL